MSAYYNVSDSIPAASSLADLRSEMCSCFLHQCRYLFRASGCDSAVIRVGDLPVSSPTDLNSIHLAESSYLVEFLKKTYPDYNVYVNKEMLGRATGQYRCDFFILVHWPTLISGGAGGVGGGIMRFMEGIYAGGDEPAALFHLENIPILLCGLFVETVP